MRESTAKSVIVAAGVSAIASVVMSLLWQVRVTAQIRAELGEEFVELMEGDSGLFSQRVLNNVTFPLLFGFFAATLAACLAFRAWCRLAIEGEQHPA